MIEAIAVLALGFIVLAIAAKATDEGRPPRMDNRIPAREYDLLGDDWREHCVQFADIRRARRQACINPEERNHERQD